MACHDAEGGKVKFLTRADAKLVSEAVGAVIVGGRRLYSDFVLCKICSRRLNDVVPNYKVECMHEGGGLLGRM